MRKAVFLDRDGTINIEKNYLYRIDDWEWTTNAVEAIKGLRQLGFLIIVVTNQAGIARGYYGHEDVIKLHQYVDSLLTEYKTKIDAYYYCPHHPEFGEKSNCQCRKPDIGMFNAAKDDFSIDFSRSFIIGDKLTDLYAGISVGAKPILVQTGYGKQECNKLPVMNQFIQVRANLYSAYKWIKEQEEKRNAESTRRVIN